VALAYIFQGLNRYFLSGAYIAKRTLHLGLIGGITAALNFGLNYVLISRYGMMGAAWATALSFMAMAGFAYWVSQHARPIPYNFFRLIIPLSVATGLYLLSTLVPSGHIVVALAIKIGIFLLFPLVLFVTGFFERREIDKAREVAQTLWTRYALRAAAASGR
jgi:O-antigen/teichoic acid export membrane protein